MLTSGPPPADRHARRRLLVATTNPHKLREIRDLLSDVRVQLVGLDELPGTEEPEETGETFEENARLKALFYDRRAKALRHGSGGNAALQGGSEVGAAPQGDSEGGAALQGCDMTVAEDSGLVVDALDGEPGVRSARFLRPDATYPERFAEILRRLDEKADQPRTARFVCAVAVVRHGQLAYEARGVIEGEIAREPRGSGGFGYDPIFFYPPYQCTLADVTQASKLHVAHRGKAFRALADWLRSSN